MIKTITYTTFIFASILVAALFITSQTFTQLGLAILLYPAIAFLALQLFPRREKEHEIIVQSPVLVNPITNTINSVDQGSIKNDVSDIDKRAFLKLIGVAGVSVFLFSLLSKRGQLPFFGKVAGSDSLTLKDSQGKTIDPAQTQPFDGYQISELEDGAVSYYGFTHQSGAWYIMREDTEENTFRYAKGTANFPKSWSGRSKLKYDYFYNA